MTAEAGCPSRFLESGDECVLLLLSYAGTAAEPLQWKPGQPALLDHDGHRVERVAAFGKRRKSGLPRRCADTLSWRKRIEHSAAANRDKRRVRAKDESIATGQHGRRLETDPRESRLARRDRRSAGHDETTDQPARTGGEPPPDPLPHG